MSDATNRINDASDITDDELRGYYERVKHVWATMSVIDGDDETLESLIVPGTAESGAKNWYAYSSDQQHNDATPSDGVAADDLFAGRPYSPRTDSDDLADELIDWDYRLPHLTINYQQRGPDDWATKVYNEDSDSNHWVDSNPLPGYGDIGAVALFADVDFAADEKRRPADEGTRERVESTLEHWRDEYAAAVNDREAVALLDSVGGTYVMLRPAVTRPICRFAADNLRAAERRVLNKELQRRWREFNSDVNDKADNWDAFEQDGDTNKNRLFKPPLAVHKQLPGVVTPIDTEDIRFKFTHWADIDDDLVEDAREWAEWFSQPEPDRADDWAGVLLETLFDDVDADSWRGDIEDWATDHEQTDATAQTNVVNNIDIDPSELTDDVTFVAQRDLPWDKIASLNCKAVAKELDVISSSDRQQRDDRTRIQVNWRKSDTGDSAFVGHTAVTDMEGMENKGGPATLVAYNLIGGDNHEPVNWRQDAEHIETVIDWFLNSRFDIPIYIPQKGSTHTADDKTQTHNRTPNWALRRVGELLDIAPSAAFNDKNDACIVPTLYNRILTVLDDAGIEHNRNRKKVRIDANGNDRQALERDIDVKQLIEDSLADITTEDAAGADDEPTWAARYDIPDRDNVTDENMSVTVPGVDLRWIEFDNGRAGWGWQNAPILNADIELLSRLDYPERREEQTEWRVRINPTVESEPSREITLTPAAFNSSREFRDRLVGKTESVVFNPDDKPTKAVNELKQLVHSQHAPRRKAHKKIKLMSTDNGAVFVTPGGTIDANGWIDDPTHVFESVAEGVQGDWQTTPDTVEGSDDDLVAEVCELLPRIRDDREQWLSMLGYTFASSLRPILFNHPTSRVNTWNILHVSGKSGAGKSAVAKTLMGALGMNAKSTTAAEKTSHAQEHMFSATNGMPIAMDEYNPQNWANWKADTFHELLKKTTDAQSKEKGNPDQTLTEYRFEVSPVVLGEQQLPESMPALPRRAVEVTLQTSSTERGTGTEARFKKLRQLSDDDYSPGLHHHALDWWRSVCEAAESPLDVVTDWHETGEWLRDELTNRGTDIDAELPRAMHQQGLQTVAFGLRCWRQFAIERGADPAQLFNDNEIIDTVEHLIDEKTGEHASNVDNEAALLELLGDAAAIQEDSGMTDINTQQYATYNEHYTLLNIETAEPTELRVHLKSTLRQLSKFKRDYGLDLTLYQKSDYYRWFKSAAEDPDSMTIDVSRRTYLGDTQKRCVAIDVEQMTDELDVYLSDLIVGDESDIHDDGNDDGPEHQRTLDIDPQPIADIDADEQLLASTIGTVETQETDHIDGTGEGPYFTTHLVDETGEARLVIWDKQDMPKILNESGTVAPETLRVQNAIPDTYDGDLQLTAKSHTVIEKSQVGTGETSYSDAGENQRLASADKGISQGTTTASPDDADIGDATNADEPTNEDIDRAIEQEVTTRNSGDGAARDAVATAVANNLGVDETRINSRIDTLLEQSRGIYEPLDNKLRPA